MRASSSKRNSCNGSWLGLPSADASPATDNDNEEGASPPPLPVALVTGVNTTTPQFLMVHADHLGRPLRLTDATRATVWSASYDPFGQPWQITGTVEQNLRFPGQYFLIESGLAYNWHRLYDASTGRYTQPDPLRFVDGPTVYGYAGASPNQRVRAGLAEMAMMRTVKRFDSNVTSIVQLHLIVARCQTGSP